MIDYDAYVQTTPSVADREHWRRQLLALLAGERAELLYLLLGLDEETLTTRPVFDDQTVKDLLAHVAAWDELHRERMALILADRKGEIASVDLDEHNAGVHARRRDWTLSRALDAFTEARQSFLETFSRVPDEQLHRPVAIPWSDALPMRTWAIWRARHDAVHAADVRRWRNDNEIEDGVGPRAILVAALEASRDEAHALSALVAEEERDSRAVADGWTLRDVVGHLADWELFLLECLEAGRMLDMGHGGDVDEWNAAHAAARREQSWAQTWEDYGRARQETIDAVQEMDQERLSTLLNNSWGRDTSTYRVVVWWLEHEREHAAGLRGALLDRDGTVEFRG
ncbi:MAG: DinB family protein [Candidatus Promineifilaceae bacterium]|nr:DinB family protein [Candidatus Promineifilaceae bacterium]